MEMMPLRLKPIHILKVLIGLIFITKKNQVLFAERIKKNGMAKYFDPAPVHQKA
jgi:hypothetical protein